MENRLQIAGTLEEATAALDPEPLVSRDPRYTDLSPARGSGAIERLRKLFERQPRGKWLHVAFASHRGAGKTTELNRLAVHLESKYLPVYFVANVELNPTQFEMEELLLAIARTIEEELRAYGPIDPKLLEEVENWFTQVVFTDDQGRSFIAGVKAEARIEGGVPFFAKLMASLNSSLRIESQHRESVKRTLKKFPGTLMTYVNKLLDAAQDRLASQGKQLLLLIDNMDRYNPRVIDELLIQSADRFKALHCHLVVTPPIGLVLRPESQAPTTVFKCETMPTVKLRDKHQAYSEFSGPGRDLLLEALGRRIHLQKLIPDTMAQDRLVFASGGAVRELFELAQDATLEANGATVTLDDVNMVLDRRRQSLRDRVDANGWWSTLRHIAGTKRLDKDDEFLQVLFQRLAFQYNGELWYDVHPLLSELPDFFRDRK